MGCLKLKYYLQKEVPGVNLVLKKGVSGKNEGEGKSCAGAYRFEFYGMEKDDEVKGSGNSLDFGARIYDPRVGRWLKIDPLFSVFPELNPFNYCANNRIIFIDADGKIFRISYKEYNEETGKTEIKTFDLNGTNQAEAPENLYVQEVIKSYNHIVDDGADTKGTLENIAERSEVTDVKLSKGLGSPYYDNYFCQPEAKE